MKNRDWFILCVITGFAVVIGVAWSFIMLSPITDAKVVQKEQSVNFAISDYLSTEALEKVLVIMEEDGKEIYKVMFSRVGPPELSITFVDKRRHGE